MCSLLLKHESKHSWLYNKIENGLGAMTRGYRRLLAATLRARWVVIIAWFIVVGLGALLFTVLKSELSPIEDRGVVFGLVTAPQGSTPQYTADQLKPYPHTHLIASVVQVPELLKAEGGRQEAKG